MGALKSILQVIMLEKLKSCNIACVIKLVVNF